MIYVRILLKSEQFSTVKQEPKLTDKSCCPTKLERQTVHLDLRIFYEQTAATIHIQNSTRDVFKTQTEDCILIACSVWQSSILTHLLRDYASGIVHQFL